MHVRNWLHSQWQARLPSEKRWISGLFALVLLLLTWQWGIAPAWRQLRTSQLQTPVLDAQYQQMLRLQMQAQHLQTQPKLTHDQARRLLFASLETLGSHAQIEVQSKQITVTLNAVEPAVLIQWLAQTRLEAKRTPSQAQLVRHGASSWDGTLVLHGDAP